MDVHDKNRVFNSKEVSQQRIQKEEYESECSGFLGVEGSLDAADEHVKCLTKT